MEHVFVPLTRVVSLYHGLRYVAWLGAFCRLEHLPWLLFLPMSLLPS